MIQSFHGNESLFEPGRFRTPCPWFLFKEVPRPNGFRCDSSCRSSARRSKTRATAVATGPIPLAFGPSVDRSEAMRVPQESRRSVTRPPLARRRSAGGLATHVSAEGGLIETALGALREEPGHKKLGRCPGSGGGVPHQSGVGLSHVWKLRPEVNTELRKEQRLWVYALNGSTRAQVITALLRPEDHNVFSALDGLVAGRHQALLPQQKLDLIRETANSRAGTARAPAVTSAGALALYSTNHCSPFEGPRGPRLAQAPSRKETGGHLPLTADASPDRTRPGEDTGTGELLRTPARRAVHGTGQRSTCGRAGPGCGGGHGLRRPGHVRRPGGTCRAVGDRNGWPYALGRR